MSDLNSRYQAVLTELGQSKLIAVSKTKSSQLIEELYQLGQRDFGENKVQELFEKSKELSHLKEIKWHFIGHLQSNKINQLLKVENLYSIHSIDRIEILEKIISKNITQSLNLFIQINTSGEKEKSGFIDYSQVLEAKSLIDESDKLNFKGLMTIGKIRTQNFEADAIQCFQELRALKERISSDLELSMGMSSDYKIAIENGANWVRIGSKIFGSRD